MLTPLPQDLHDANKLVIIEEIDHDDALPTIRRALMKASPIRNCYFLANIVVFASAVGFWRCPDELFSTSSAISV